MTAERFETALAQAGVTAETLSPQERQALDVDGYLMLRGVFDAAQIETLRETFEKRYVPSDQWPMPRAWDSRHSMLNEEVEVHSTVLQRVADWIAWFSGSMLFLIINGVWFISWIAINTLPLGIPAFDPYPFGLLTMIVSLEAIFLSCFVLISLNRQAEKDRVRSDIEYEVNIKAELEIGHLHEKADRIYENRMARFSALEKQIAK